MSTEQHPNELRGADQSARITADVSGEEEQPAQDSDQLHEEIDQTRQQLGDTVEALADKADVKKHARERVEQRKEQLRDLGQRAQTKLADTQQVKQLAGAAQQRARNNPPMAVGAVVAVVAAVSFVRRRGR